MTYYDRKFPNCLEHETANARDGDNVVDDVLRLALRLVSRNQKAEVWVGTKLVGIVSSDFVANDLEQDRRLKPLYPIH